MINRNTPVPLYYQLMQELKQRIESGELLPGDTLPTEVQLMEACEVSRATVRQAVLRLVQEGLVRRIKGRGTFVNTLPEKPRFIGTLKGFAEEMRQKGVPCRTEVLDQCIEPASPFVAEKLHIPLDSDVFFLKRLRYIHDEPVLIARSHIPARLCRGIEQEDFETGSLYEILQRRYRLVLRSGRREFEPVLPSSSEEVKLLKIGVRTPILRVQGIMQTEDETPVEYVIITMRGTFMVDLVQA